MVLLLPQPVAAQVDGLRRALGDGARTRIPPHVTLVPPINVHERDLPDALATVRRAAAEHGPLTLALGPVRTFAPATPVAYLAVEGPDLAALHALRAAVRSGPLDRPDVHEFVPHVTVADGLPPERLEVAPAVLADFAAEIAVDRVHVLAEAPGRVWGPIADAPLGGAGSGTVGRGSLPLDIAVTGRPDLEAAALLALDAGTAPGLPFAVTARRDGVLLGAAWGWTSGDRLEVADLVVTTTHRNEGIGRHLLAAVEGVARRRGCTALGAAAPADGAPAALAEAAGWVRAPGAAADAADRPRTVRWERRLPAPDRPDDDR